jgi:hypothetical protein
VTSESQQGKSAQLSKRTKTTRSSNGIITVVRDFANCRSKMYPQASISKSVANPRAMRLRPPIWEYLSCHTSAVLASAPTSFRELRMNTLHLSPDKLPRRRGADRSANTMPMGLELLGCRTTHPSNLGRMSSFEKYYDRFRSQVGFVKKTQRKPDRPASVESRYYLQESLTIFTFVMVKCPCSLFFSVAPLSFAISCVSSFMLCNLAFDTTPVAVTVWPT